MVPIIYTCLVLGAILLNYLVKDLPPIKINTILQFESQRSAKFLKLLSHRSHPLHECLHGSFWYIFDIIALTMLGADICDLLSSKDIDYTTSWSCSTLGGINCKDSIIFTRNALSMISVQVHHHPLPSLTDSFLSTFLIVETVNLHPWLLLAWGSKSTTNNIQQCH